MTATIKAIPYSENDNRTDYLVMVGHAGRRHRTGSKVHVATLSVWKETGKVTVSACNCSSNGRLRGQLITTPGYDFSKVSCRNCGSRPETASARNRKAIDLVVNL